MCDLSVFLRCRGERRSSSIHAKLNALCNLVQDMLYIRIILLNLCMYTLLISEHVPNSVYYFILYSLDYIYIYIHFTFCCHQLFVYRLMYVSFLFNYSLYV